MIKFIFARESPKTEKYISSHLIIGAFSRKSLNSSIFSKSISEEVQPISKSTSFRSTKV